MYICIYIYMTQLENNSCNIIPFFFFNFLNNIYSKLIETIILVCIKITVCIKIERQFEHRICFKQRHAENIHKYRFLFE